MFVINVLLLAWFRLSAIDNLRMYWLSVSFVAKYSIRKPLIRDFGMKYVWSD